MVGRDEDVGGWLSCSGTDVEDLRAAFQRKLVEEPLE
jgi:hypothetical protein